MCVDGNAWALCSVLITNCIITISQYKEILKKSVKIVHTFKTLDIFILFKFLVSRTLNAGEWCDIHSISKNNNLIIWTLWQWSCIHCIVDLHFFFMFVDHNLIMSWSNDWLWWNGMIVDTFSQISYQRCPAAMKACYLPKTAAHSSMSPARRHNMCQRSNRTLKLGSTLNKAERRWTAMLIY